MVEAKRKENEAANRAKAENEELRVRMQSMEKESKEPQKQLFEAAKAQNEAQGFKERLRRLEKKAEAVENQNFITRLLRVFVPK